MNFEVRFRLLSVNNFKFVGFPLCVSAVTSLASIFHYFLSCDVQQAAQEITESVVNVARTELADISSNQIEKTAEQSDHYVVMQLKDQDVSNATKDLSTIIETLVSDETARMNGELGIRSMAAVFRRKLIGKMFDL